MSHRRAPIDVYWDLMRDDKPKEARDLLEAHPDDAACLLELYASCSIPFQSGDISPLRKAADLGNYTAMAMLGAATEDLDLLHRVQRSGPPYAKALALQQNFDGFGETLDELLTLYEEACENPESPRVFLSFVDLLDEMPIPFRLNPRIELAIRTCLVHASVRGVPRAIYKLADLMLDEPETPERSREIVRLLQRPAVRDWPEAISLLAFAYGTFRHCLDLGAEATLTLSLPSSYLSQKLSALAVRLRDPVRTKDMLPLDELCRCFCIYGRALAQGKMGLPPIPDMFDHQDPEPGDCSWLHSVFEETVRFDETVGLLNSPEATKYVEAWVHLRNEMSDWTPAQLDKCLVRLARNYRRWIRTVRDTLMEFLLACRWGSPSLHPNVAKMIALSVWNDRERDAPLWCKCQDVISFTIPGEAAAIPKWTPAAHRPKRMRAV